MKNCCLDLLRSFQFGALLSNRQNIKKRTQAIIKPVTFRFQDWSLESSVFNFQHPDFLVLQMQLHLRVSFFNPSKATWPTIMKLGTIDQHRRVNVIGAFVTSPLKKNLLKFAFLDGGKQLFAETKASPKLPTLRKFFHSRKCDDVTLNN